ncbi:hypothetical protein NDU88_001878 [Pleurodeles waltl]|uniref:Uncharacterized protein n=1 Tax=Pleurodeles waltl TaxID=8319 RepID=A0AAV7TJ27_PLEWA|nr:hypothetical protein NDU88_001878 [Pleurodeles waltl]
MSPVPAHLLRCQLWCLCSHTMVSGCLHPPLGPSSRQCPPAASLLPASDPCSAARPRCLEVPHPPLFVAPAAVCGCRHHSNAHLLPLAADPCSADPRCLEVPQPPLFIAPARKKLEESVDVFYARLHKLASTCILPDEKDNIRAQFIQGCAASKLRKRILQEPNMWMKDILTLGRSQELSKARAAHLEETTTVQVKTEPINAVATGPSKSRAVHRGVKTRDKPCRWCGGSLPHQAGYPA